MSVIVDTASAAQRVATANVNAEVRAIEAGRNVRFDADRGRFLVLSESGRRTYELTVSAVGDLLRLSCTCPAGVKGSQLPAGRLGCKHRAATARRLESMGWASFGTDGLWHVTSKALEAAGAL